MLYFGIKYAYCHMFLHLKVINSFFKIFRSKMIYDSCLKLFKSKKYISTGTLSKLINDTTAQKKSQAFSLRK